MKTPMRVYYDEEGDFLEISVGEPAESNATEIGQGIFLRRDSELLRVSL